MKRFFSSFLIIATLLGFSSWAYSEGMTGGGPGMTGQTGFQAIYRSNEYRLMDTDRTHYLRIIAGSDLTANRLLTLTTGDAARTITLSGNPTLADWFDQAVKTSSTPVFPTIYGSASASGTLTLVSTSHATKGRIDLVSNDATTDAVVDVLRVDHTTTGTAANNIGTGIVLYSEDASGNVEEAGRIQALFPVAAHATQTGRIDILPFGAAAGSGISILKNASGTVNIGFGTVTPAKEGFAGTTLTIASTTTSDGNAIELWSNTDSLVDTATQYIVALAGTGPNRIAQIGLGVDGTSENSGYIRFDTMNAGVRTEKVRIIKDGNFGIGTATPIYLVDSAGAINSRVYYWVEEFDDEVSGVQFESGLQADFWTTAGTNYAAGNVTYLAGVGGTLKAMCAAADNDSVTALGTLNSNTTQNPIMEVRVKIDTKETAAFYVGFVSAAFADVNGAFPNDAFLVGINSDNGHTFGATQIVAASVDNGAAVDYDDMGVAIVSNTYVKIKIDLTDTEQPRVWINDTEVAAGSIGGTVQAGVALAPYFMVQNLAGGAIQRFITMDYAKMWQDR